MSSFSVNLMFSAAFSLLYSIPFYEIMIAMNRTKLKRAQEGCTHVSIKICKITCSN